MSYHPGAYCGGIRKLADLRNRSFVDDETGCWMWRGAFSSGVPKVYAFNPEKGKFQVLSGCRAAWIIADKGPIGANVIYHSKCSSMGCVNPAHLSIGTRKEAGVHLASTNRLKGDQHRMLINIKNGRKTSRYTPELRDFILGSELTNVAVARETGISQGLVSEIRRGRRWTTAPANSSVFNWRGAA